MSAEAVGTLIVGAGMSGLGYANFASDPRLLVLEAENEPGGYCRTVHQDGFVWDYSGHFFHFRHPEIERYLTARMPPDTVRSITKSSKIKYGDRLVDFPFQKNIHQLPQAEFIDCLYDLYFRAEHAPAPLHPQNTRSFRAVSFRDMLYAKFGRSIAEKFLVPYNEKLYACDLGALDEGAMGRFFPHADIDEIVRNFKRPDNTSYNATFTYPRGGAVEYVNALLRDLPRGKLALGERLVALDVDAHLATTTRRTLRYDRVVSSAPLPQLLRLASVPHEPRVFTSNKVLVFNLGFDRKGWEDVHWVYFPERRYGFYRVGFYDNIFGDNQGGSNKGAANQGRTERMSLYVELGMATDAPVDISARLRDVLVDLRAADVTTDAHNLVSWHSVVLDPAYAHITRESIAETERTRAWLAKRDVHAIGRYGGWTYCAIEDNLVEARALVEVLEGRRVDL